MTALAPHAPLRRFVTAGLRDTVDSYTAGTLPLHRFSWELESRLATLAELTGLPRYRTLVTLRAAQHAVATIDVELRTSGRDALTAAEDHTVAAAITTLRTGLAQLDPTDPSDPASPARPRPASGSPVMAAVTTAPLPVPEPRRPTGGHRPLVA
jgi:hypothetical protein